MLKRMFTQTALLIGMALLFVTSAPASENLNNPADSPVKDPGFEAFSTAVASGQYLMVLFERTNDTSELKTSFDLARLSLSGSVKSVIINTNKPEESGLVDRYNVRFAPLPMVVLLAPNGAITGFFKTAFTPGQLKARFLSPVSQQCLLAFQQKKLVFMCIQGQGTKQNSEAMGGVTQFKADPKLGKIAEVVMLDPTDQSEKKLLNQLGINSDTAVAETLLMAPPGKVLGKWSGATSKDAFAKLLVAEAGARKSCRIPGCADPSCPTPQASSSRGGVQ